MNCYRNSTSRRVTIMPEQIDNRKRVYGIGYKIEKYERLSHLFVTILIIGPFRKRFDDGNTTRRIRRRIVRKRRAGRCFVCRVTHGGQCERLDVNNYVSLHHLCY